MSAVVSAPTPEAAAEPVTINDRFGPLFLPVLVVAILGALLGQLGPNPVETAASMLTLPILFALLWRVSPTPALLAAMLMQWAAVTASVLYASLRGEHFSRIHEELPTASLESAFWVALAGVVTFSIGIRLAGRARATQPHVFEIPARQLIATYLAARLVVFPVIRFAGDFIGGLRQPLLTLPHLQWVLFAILFDSHVRKKLQPTVFPMIVAFEVILGFASYFASFRDSLVIVIVLAASRIRRLRPRDIVVGAVALVLLFEFGSFWSSVKGDYRKYLNQGSGRQEVVVETDEALKKVFDLSASYDEQQRLRGQDAFIRRLVYIDFLSLSMDRVPLEIPHEGGEIWKDSILHVLMPRLLFPDKATVSDSAQVEKYTGYTTNENTSISLGYVAESYIDFGFPWMLVPILALGFWVGRLQRYLVENAPTRNFAIGMSLVPFFAVFVFGARLAKILGETTMVLLVFALLYRYVLPRVPQSLLRTR